MPSKMRTSRTDVSRKESAKRPASRSEIPASLDRAEQPGSNSVRERDGFDVRSLSPRDVQWLQRTAGNRVVGHLLHTRPLQHSSTIRPGVTRILRRIENPHAKATAHEGWDTTAHHIIPYSKLEAALGKLSPSKRSEILKLAIPSVLTETMMDNLKIAIEDTVEARANLRERLVSEAPDTEEISGISFGDIRSSFFLWQGGNQFQGPNTTIRPEPSSDKDTIDFDGKFFSSLSQETFKTLTDEGEKLGTLDDESAITESLKKILAITKDVTPQVFDSAKWTEVASREELEKLAKLSTLGRSHLLGYSFFKLPQSEMGSGKKYSAIAPKGGGEFLYREIIIPVQIKGTWAYIAYNDTKNERYTPKTETSATLASILTQKGVTFSPDGNAYKLTVNAAITVNGKKFSVSGYDDQIPCTVVDSSTILVPKGIVDKRMMKTVERQQSLYDYCVETGMPTSTFLPKALYESLGSLV